jgi:hypothetical protein
MENCSMEGKHMCITHLFLNNFIKMVNFPWIPYNWELTVHEILKLENLERYLKKKIILVYTR